MIATRSGRVTANSTASATSSTRIMSLRFVNPGFSSGFTSSQMSVSTGPGEIRVVRTPDFAVSARITSCMPRSPNLLAAYAVDPGKPM